MFALSTKSASRLIALFSLTKTAVFIALIMSCSLLTGLSHAQENREGYNYWYGGIAGMSLKSDYLDDKVLQREHDRRYFSRTVGGDADYGQRRIELNDATTGYKVYVGVSPNESWDWEGGFIDFGESEGEFTAGQVSPVSLGATRLKAVSDVKAMFLHFQYRFRPPFFPDIEGLELVPKLGILAWDGKTETVFTAENGAFAPLTNVDNDRGYDEYYGLGLSYHIYENVRVRIDYDRYTIGSANADAASLSIDFPVPRIPYIMWD